MEQIDRVRNFLNADWNALENQAGSDFSIVKQAALKKAMSQCQQDTGDAHAADSEDFHMFAMCLRSQVLMTPALNQSRVVLSQLNGMHY